MTYKPKGSFNLLAAIMNGRELTPSFMLEEVFDIEPPSLASGDTFTIEAPLDMTMPDDTRVTLKVAYVFRADGTGALLPQ
jgi:hypothetical protein